MKIACLIVTYTSAKQTKRMIDKLNNGSFDFYIHVDKKLELETHRILFDTPNVYFINERVDVKWAGFSTVQAAFNGIKQIAASGNYYDFVNLITGQDYPIKSADYIIDFLQQNTGKQFVEYKDFETDWQEANARVDRFHFENFNIWGKHKLAKIINFFSGKRKMPGNLHMYGISTFWTLSLECAVYVVKYVEEHKDLNRFLQYTWGSDEFIFQTVLMSSPYKEHIVNNNYRYVDWSAGGARPKFLKTEDFDQIITSDSIFGRKFNIEIDENILDLIDAHNVKTARTKNLI